MVCARPRGRYRGRGAERGTSASGTGPQERSAKKNGSKSSSGKSGAKRNRPETKSKANFPVRVEVDLSDGHAVVVDDDLSWSGERFVPVRFSDGHQRYLRADELNFLK